ncbi:Phosphatase 2C family protein [Quillaja saponaria]|uniref:Protein phosphatase n=1 Tax=Quillaja saponaria TaxID=32244 RepID=A0AAD7P6R7_QUISA|nr:Phosphatase 2C family protein [Quillaja saponaria]KAJ7944324.1 Phosphatase 2C family protein [Quillaja saponaria]
MPSGVLSKFNTTIFNNFQKAITQQQGRPLSSINLLLGQRRSVLRTSVLSVSYWSSLLFATTQFSSSHAFKRRSMAASTSKAVLGDVHVDDFITSCGNATDLTKPTGVYFKARSCDNFQKASMSSRKQEPLSGRLICSGYSNINAIRRNHGSSLLLGTWLSHFCNSSLSCFSVGAAHDVSFDGSSQDEQLSNSSILSDKAFIGGKTLKLFSGSCYLPHPDKEETGGEDAHFICTDQQVFGVADGVGGWAEVGVDAGKFARELMSNSVRAIQEEAKGFIDPARVLEKAHSSTKAKGSSTACIIALTDKGLHAINLGDSGFIVVRDGSTVFQSPVQQHGFNFTYQLESGNGGDLPSSGEVFTIPVTPGDVIIAGTDGLFDNLYYNEVTAIVVHAVRAELEPQVTAQKIAALARQRARDKNKQTPFSTAAQEAGFRYYGGKLDDITVVVSYITSSASA